MLKFPWSAKHPQRSAWLLIACSCVVPALLGAVQQYVKGAIFGTEVEWKQVMFQGFEWLFLGCLTSIAYGLGSRFPPSRKHWRRAVVIHALGAILLCIAWASLGMILAVILNTYPFWGSLRNSYVPWVLQTLPYAVFMYFAVLGCIYSLTYFSQARQREAYASQLSAQLAEARLGALRMQLNPHFLFKSLNAITVLVNEQRTREASEMLELLSSVLRQVLNSDQRQKIPLAAELAFVRQYLEIEQIRFSDRLTIAWSIPQTLHNALVPPLILQPLVENAIRHGIAKRADSGHIRICVDRLNGRLRLFVTDDGAGLGDSSLRREGVGLSNTRERLHTLYGESASLEIRPAAVRGTEVVVVIPYEVVKTDGSD